MKSSSFKTGMISVIAAVVLWLAATWFEDDAHWMPPELPAAQFDNRPNAPRQDTPVRVATDVVSCSQAELSLQAKVDSAQYCATDDDCTLFDYGYPIQCLTSVSKSEISALRIEYRNYENSCAYRVYYDCPSGEMERVAVCRNNRCAVDLVSTDPLQDATLQHLGIKDL